MKATEAKWNLKKKTTHNRCSVNNSREEKMLGTLVPHHFVQAACSASFSDSISRGGTIKEQSGSFSVKKN